MSVAFPAVDFMLPGRWWRFPLGTEQEMRRSARAMAVQALGRADHLAQLRSELCAQVVQAARSAKAARGTEFYFGLEIAPGMPLPMSLTVYWPDVPVPPSRHAGHRLAAESLAASLAGMGRGEVSVLDSEDFGVVRVVGGQPPTGSPAEGDGAELERLRASRLDVAYWILNPASPRTLLLSFSTSLGDFQDAVLELGDAIVATVMWGEDVDENDG